MHSCYTDDPNQWPRRKRCADVNDTDCAGFVPTILAHVVGASSERCRPAYSGRYWDLDANCDDGEPWFPLAP